MAYLEYETNTRQVVEIHTEAPAVQEGYAYAVSDDFSPGDEFEQTIWVNKVDKDKNVTSYSAIRNNPNAARLLKENEQLKAENTQLKSELDSAIIELTVAMSMGGGA